MPDQKSQNVVYGNKQLTVIPASTTPVHFQYKGRDFCVEESGISNRRAFVRLSPANDKIAEILIEQIEKNGNICPHDLLKKLEMS